MNFFEFYGYVKDKNINLVIDHDKAKVIRQLLLKYNDDGNEPNPVASGMSWIKTNIMLTLNVSDSTIAHLMTDGCNMGVKSLNWYLNGYAADEVSKYITKRLIKFEEKLSDQIRKFL